MPSFVTISIFIRKYLINHLENFVKRNAQNIQSLDEKQDKIFWIQLKDKYMETAEIMFVEATHFMLYLEHNYM